MARCVSFKNRIYGGDFELTTRYDLTSQLYLGKLKQSCPLTGGDDNISPLDYVTPTLFDNAFFKSLVKGDGLLNSDQEMYSSLMGFKTSDLVKRYAADPIAFFKQFSDSMVKMGNITTPESGEVRASCRFVNA